MSKWMVAAVVMLTGTWEGALAQDATVPPPRAACTSRAAAFAEAAARTNAMGQGEVARDVQVAIEISDTSAKAQSADGGGDSVGNADDEGGKDPKPEGKRKGRNRRSTLQKVVHKAFVGVAAIVVVVGAVGLVMAAG